MPDEEVKQETPCVLYLTHPESDYGGAMLYQGLCELLGAENVCDYPIKYSYHGYTHHYQLPTRAPGQTAPLPWFTPVHDFWIALDAKRCHPDVLRRADPIPLYDDDIVEAVRGHVKDGAFRFVVVESPRQVALDMFYTLRREIRNANLPVVLHDGEDFQDLFPILPDNVGADVLLKREIDPRSPSRFFLGATRVVAFPFSCASVRVLEASRTPIEDAERADCAFYAGMTHAWRQEMADLLRDATDLVADVRLNNDARGTAAPLLPWELYIANMARAYCAVNVRGWGWDTVRHWEIPAITAMVTTTPGVCIDNALQHGAHCMIGNNPSECLQHVRALKGSRELRDAIFAQGREHVLQHHTNKARAQFVLEQLHDMRRI